MKRLDEIDLRKYDAHQLKAVREVFDAMMSDVPKRDLQRDVTDFASWETDTLELDKTVELFNAEEQARRFAQRRNAGRPTASDVETDEDREIKTGVLNWLALKNKRGHGKKTKH
jgi:hypothetical protein